MKKVRKTIFIIAILCVLSVLAGCIGSERHEFFKYAPFSVPGKWVCQEKNIWFKTEEYQTSQGFTRIRVTDGEYSINDNLKKHVYIDYDLPGAPIIYLHIYNSSQKRTDLICIYSFQSESKKGKFILTATGKKDYQNNQEDFFTEGEVLTFVLEEED